MKNCTISTRGVVGFAITATAGVLLTVFASGSSPFTQTATARGVAMYEADMGRYPVRGSRYLSENDTAYAGTAIPIEMLSMDLVGSVAPSESIATPPPGETARVDSFFDIFTEIRVDGSRFNVDSFFDITYRMTNTTPGGTSDIRTFETEMLSMSLQGDIPGVGPIVIRESPTLASLGKHAGVLQADGRFNVDSFFDVWTEVSIAGGPFVPADSSIRLSLVSVAPEPTSALMLVLASLAALGYRRRR